MFKFAFAGHRLVAMLGLCVLAAMGAAPTQDFVGRAAAQTGATGLEAVPDLSGRWVRRGQFPSTYEIPQDPSLRPGPLVNTITGENQGLVWVADHTNALLKPWVAEYLRLRGEAELITVGTIAHNLCWPSGVPQAINLRENVTFLQEENLVTILYQRDHMVRRVYLNEEHPDNLTPSWYGHSVGHYEGDTLVIDTIGMNANTGTDRFNTPHTEQLHVVERYRVIEDGEACEALRVTIRVEDPGAFNMVWYAQATYRRNQNGFEEIVCMENNRDVVTGRDYPGPVDYSPDF